MQQNKPAFHSANFSLNNKQFPQGSNGAATQRSRIISWWAATILGGRIALKGASHQEFWSQREEGSMCWVHRSPFEVLYIRVQCPKDLPNTQFTGVTWEEGCYN